MGAKSIADFIFVNADRADSTDHGPGSASWGSTGGPWKLNPHMGQLRAGLISPQPGHLRSMRPMLFELTAPAPSTLLRT
jgi:hypothetical protein